MDARQQAGCGPEATSVRRGWSRARTAHALTLLEVGACGLLAAACASTVPGGARDDGATDGSSSDHNWDDLDADADDADAESDTDADGDADSDADSDADADADSDADSDSDSDADADGDIERKVDILFVIDNSASMATAQRRLADAIPALIEVMEDPASPVLYRIGITTTDVGVPANVCNTIIQSPADGRLSLRSCRTHTSDFVTYAGTALETDNAGHACLEICDEAVSDAIQQGTTPTSIEGSDALASRPWIERVHYDDGDGGLNLPAGVDAASALACALPVGLNGCPYEAPLQAMRRAVERGQTDGAPQQGFLRSDAELFVIFVTDEADCSVDASTPGATSHFSPAGPQTFWEDPTNFDTPTSAVCFNAGMACSPEKTPGSPQLYDDCQPANWTADGALAAPDEPAMMHRISGYLDLVDALAAGKRAGQGVSMVVIGGVPIGSSRRPIAIAWQDEGYGPVNDQEHFSEEGAGVHQALYGIGVGCVRNPGLPASFEFAIPPARVLTLVDALATPQVASPRHSICEDGYWLTMQAIGQHVRSVSALQ